MSVRKAQKEQTRETLLAAARACFARNGWGATVVADIAREAGVAHGTFYVHFRDKNAVADALLAEFNAALAARLTRAVGRAATREARVRSAARAFVAILEANPGFVRWYAERLTSGALTEALVDGVNPEALALVDRWLADEGIDAARRSLLARGLLALWIRVGLRTVLAGESKRAAEDVLVASTVGAIKELS